MLLLGDRHRLPPYRRRHQFFGNCSRPAGARGYGRGLKRVLALKG
jgi:hypothetical protein